MNPIEINVTAKTIGRNTLTKYCTITAIFIALILVITALILGYGLDTFVSNMTRDTEQSFAFFSIQIFVAAFSIYLIGGVSGELIIRNKRSGFAVGFLSLLLLWLVLFFSCAVTAAITNSIKYGIDGLVSGFIGWMIFGLIPFILWGTIHGLVLGYLLGNEIRNKGRRISSNRDRYGLV